MKLHKIFDNVRKKVFVVGKLYKIAEYGKHHNYSYRLLSKKTDRSDTFLFDVYDSQGESKIHQFENEHHRSCRLVPLEKEM